jgi:MoxR-like ATPase
VLRAVNKLIDAGKLPHLLLYGPPGTGKTSTVLACARRLYGAEMGRMVLEVRAIIVLPLLSAAFHAHMLRLRRVVMCSCVSSTHQTTAASTS